MKIKANVFDLGGTLMDYKGMPLNWNEYYYQGFQNVNIHNNLNLFDNEVQVAVDILKSYNPRNCGREKEIRASVLFKKATEKWNHRPSVDVIINDFFAGMQLESQIFDYTEELLKECKKKNLFVACLTDLPNGMPDYIFKSAIKDIEKYLDLYVSSQTCGFRKPNKKGINYIADFFGIKVTEILFVGDEKKINKQQRMQGVDLSIYVIIWNV